MACLQPMSASWLVYSLLVPRGLSTAYQYDCLMAFANCVLFGNLFQPEEVKLVESKAYFLTFK